MKCEICIDVDDVAEAVRFYGEGIGLSVVKHEKEWAQLKLGEQTIWLMKLPAGRGGAKRSSGQLRPAESWKRSRKRPSPTLLIRRATAWIWFKLLTNDDLVVLKSRTGSCLSVLAAIAGAALFYCRDVLPADAAPSTFVIRNVRIFDGEKLIPSNSVTVVHGKIVGVGSNLRAPQGAEVIDGSDDTLLPGLIDSHITSGFETLCAWD